MTANEKAALRAQMKAVAAAIPPQENAAMSARIVQKLLARPEYMAAKTVFCFVGTAQEIDTTAFLARALADGKILCVPFCETSSVLHAKQIASLKELTLGKYGIPTADESAPTAPPQEIDFAVIPCLAADASGNRLGYGNGFYDRYLAQLRDHCTTALVVRAPFLQKHVPAEPHDIAAQLVITDSV